MKNPSRTLLDRIAKLEGVTPRGPFTMGKWRAGRGLSIDGLGGRERLAIDARVATGQIPQIREHYERVRARRAQVAAL